MRPDNRKYWLGIVCTVFVICLCFVQPDRIFASAEGGTEQIAASGQKLAFQGEGRTFQVSGSNNIITISGECRKLEVAGHHNRIRLETVGAIEVAGHDNVVSFQQGTNGGRPVTSTVGHNNQIVRSSAPSEPPSGGGESSAPGSPVDRAPSAGKVAEGTVVLKGSNQNIDRPMHGEPVDVEGNNNRVVLTGSVETLSVSGSNNSLTVDSVKKVILTGSNNVLSYQGTAPQVEDRAANNVLRSR